MVELLFVCCLLKPKYGWQSCWLSLWSYGEQPVGRSNVCLLFSRWFHSSLLRVAGISDAHGVVAFDFANVADCSQLVNGPTHRAGGMLDLVPTNVPDLCDVHVHGNVGRSDHASLGVALNLSPTVAGFDVARRVPLKSRVNWNAVCEALSGLNWRSIFRSPTMVQDFDREVGRIMDTCSHGNSEKRRERVLVWWWL